MQKENLKEEKSKKTTDDMLTVIEQRFDTEAIAQMVEQMSFSKDLSQRLKKAFDGLNWGISRNNHLIKLTQEELRNLILDVELLKRAMTSLGQVGILQRRKIEKELILELFPPTRPRPGAGVKVYQLKNKDHVKIDCESRLSICKAACCRIFSVYLTHNEVESERYEWNPREPYALAKNRYGCVYLQAGGCMCRRYADSRPVICVNFSCVKDHRIWLDYEKKILNPRLEKLLKKLDVDTSVHQGIVQFYKHENDSDCKIKQSECLETETISGQIDMPLTDPENALSSDSDERSLSNSDNKDKLVEPPDFSELREIMVPEPSKKFVPPEISVPEGESEQVLDNSE
jgi:hypothetical protein